ncbi:MAG: four helix bundle protein [Candidatus Firestonebacteria bacterium]
MKVDRDLKKRTKSYALSIIGLTKILQNISSNKVIINQLLRSSTSVGANYLAACYAKSKIDFLNKIKIVEEEIVESRYWLELLHETNDNISDKINYQIKETTELISIFAATIVTIKKSLNNK